VTHIEGVLHEVAVLQVLEELDHVLDVVVHAIKEPVEPLEYLQVRLPEVFIELEESGTGVDPFVKRLP